MAQLIQLPDVELEDEVTVTSKQVLEDAAEPPDVDSVRVWLLQKELGRHEPERADCGDRSSEAHLYQLLVLDGMVEVGDLDESFSREAFGLRQLLLRFIVIPQDVRWLDVAVHDVPVFMQVEQAFADLAEYALDLWVVQS